MDELLISPYSLLSSDRLDIVAKYLYARNYYRFQGSVDKWIYDLYMDHIRVLNNFVEGDGTKIGINEFTESFDQILKTLQVNYQSDDLPAISVGLNGVVVDGAHRTAACLALNIPVRVIQKNTREIKYDSSFFAIHGLPAKYCNMLVYEYCKLKSNTRVALVFPAAKGHTSDVDLILGEYGKVIYKTNVMLGVNGSFNLIRQVYKNEVWLGNWANGFRGAREKTTACFPDNGSLLIYIFETDHLDEISAAKQKIRNIYNIGNHSIHINDSHQETISLTQLLLNENSIHNLNFAELNNFSWFNSLLEEYKKWLVAREDKEDFCIVGSAVLAAYGIRQARDLDYICVDNRIQNPDLTDIDCHNNEWQMYGYDLRDIVNNPSNFFYYDGIKFCSLVTIAKIKTQRGEQKDIQDLNSLANLLSIDETISPPMLRKINSIEILYYKIKTWIKFLIPPRLLRLLLFPRRFYGSRKHIKK